MTWKSDKGATMTANSSYCQDHIVGSYHFTNTFKYSEKLIFVFIYFKSFNL